MTDVNQLLTDMRHEVVWTHVATMPISLCKRMEVVIKEVAANQCKFGLSSPACDCEVCKRLY